MPQPTFSGSPRTCLFGGLALPNGQGTMANINLNDWRSWFLQADFQMDITAQITTAQAAWRGKGSRLAVDFGATLLHLPAEYREASAPIGQALAPMLMGGEQNLTFDSTTAIRCSFVGSLNRAISFIGPSRVLRWVGDLQFLATAPWFQDLTPTVVSPVTLNSGGATNFNVTHLGSIWCEPVWTLTIPNTNAAAIASFRLQNTMAGDDLTVTFPSPLPASTAAVVTIDSGAMTVVDGNGVAYDVSGTAFPLLYPPAGQVQQIRGTLTPVSGTATGCTIGASYSNRWLI